MIFLERGESKEDETKSTVTIIEEVCEDICEHYCEYRNTIDSYGECDMQRESGKCPLLLICLTNMLFLRSTFLCSHIFSVSLRRV